MGLESGGGGSGRRSGGGRGRVPRWNDVPKSRPDAIPGTHSYDPRRDEEPRWHDVPKARPARTPYERLQLVQLTPYVAPDAGTPEYGTSNKTADVLPHMRLESWVTRDGKLNPEMKTSEQVAAEQAQAVKPQHRRSYEMSWDDYNKLSEEQRAAVDLNTLLIQAREKDLTTDYQATPGQREQYDKAVQQMFGPDGGSETFAPETLAVLRQADFKPAAGDDLDNYLGVGALISEKELKNFDTKPIEVSLDVPELLPGTGGKVTADVASREAQLATAATRLREKLAEARTLMTSFRDSAALDRNGELRIFGGTPNDVHAPPGWGQGTYAATGERNIHDAFRETFDALARKGSDTEQIWSWFNERTSPSEKQAFLRYLDERSGQAEAYGLTLGEVKGAKYRSAEEFRTLFGLSKGD